MTLATRALLLALAAASAGACHRTQTARLPEPPTTLDIPPPPSRVIIPVILAAYEPPPPAPEPEAPVLAPARPAVRPTEKPAPPPTPPPADSPAPVLQTTANANESEQKVLRVLQTADRDLNMTPYNELSPNGKDHYQVARRFMAVAYDQLKIKNYMYAEYVANKAAAVAAQLVKR